MSPRLCLGVFDPYLYLFIVDLLHNSSSIICDNHRAQCPPIWRMSSNLLFCPPNPQIFHLSSIQQNLVFSYFVLQTLQFDPKKWLPSPFFEGGKKYREKKKSRVLKKIEQIKRLKKGNVIVFRSL